MSTQSGILRASKPGALTMRFALGSMLAASGLATASDVVQLDPPPPDPCVATQLDLTPPQTFDLDPPSGASDTLAGIRIYVDPDVPSHRVRTKPVVLVVNGNGYQQADYAALGNYLAAQGYIAAVARRPTNVVYDHENFVLDSLAAVLDHQGLDATTPVGLIGHSVGGSFVLDAAVQNTEQSAGFDIRAVVGLAPKLVGGTAIPGGADVDGLMMLFGSQDHDVEGLGASATDAFAIYDLSGNEGSTTCHAGFCLSTPTLDKRMLFIHGADHSGLIDEPRGLPPFGGWEFPNAPFLATHDQFCVAKGYALALLRTHLNGDTRYKRMLDGRYEPPSIAAITSSIADAQGNPAGSALRTGLQQSPRLRSVIENFEDGAWSTSHQTATVDVAFVPALSRIGGESNIRHASDALEVRWPVHNTWQLLGFNTVAGRRDVRSFSRVALRIGQVHHDDNDGTGNAPNTAQRVYVGLNDGTTTSWKWSDAYADIPPNDFRPGGDYTHSVMNTVAIPLSAFSGIDKSNIRAVILAFPGGTTGTLLIDNLEWFKD
jgi:pimeloyl-ACP methyl ester carboxylesterase